MQEEYFGFDSIRQLSAIIEKNGIKRALLFTGRKSFEKIKDRVLAQLPCDFDICHDFDINPKLHQVEETMMLYDIRKYQAIIACGGGSVLDFAKLFKYYSLTALSGAMSDTDDCIDKEMCSDYVLPFIAIPTTAGTGSEATQFAVVYIDGVKNSLDHISVLPNYSLIDSQFLLDSPQYLKACSAIDAFCQGIESYWSVLSTAQSKEYAKEAILLSKTHIRDFVLKNEQSYCEAMAKAANLAGKAINISRTTAAHALSYKIGTRYHIPHGHAVCLSMVDLFEANKNVSAHTCQDARGVEYVQKTMEELLQFLDIDNFTNYWHTLLDDVALEWRFDVLGITDRQEIFDSVNLNRLKNNPTRLFPEILETFYRHSNFI